MIASCIFSSLFSIIGLTALIYNYYFNTDSGLFFLIWGGGFALAGLSTCYNATIGAVSSKKQRFIYDTQTLDWYKNNYPNFVHSTNVIQCCFCKNNLIKPYYIKNRTYKISHYCAKCGEVLFYSDER